MIRSVYKNVVKPILFNFDAEKVHTSAIKLGENLGKFSFSKQIIQNQFGKKYPRLSKKIAGITFPSPIGLAAGFDYEGRLTQILPCLGFGFQTIGTITNLPYGGNKKPILSRLPDQKALIVNKGFKNLGADATISYLSNKKFAIPVGISIGKTNTPEVNTQKKAIDDIISCFKKFERADLGNSFYELNISCPNLFGSVTFYPPKNLRKLLSEVEKLNIKKPIFVKMPITEEKPALIKMTEIILSRNFSGVIIGNLWKNPDIRGGISGKPTFERSNEIISLLNKTFGKKLIIIGCGGVFSAKDAKEKLSRGASLVQLITGMVYEGPQLISEINVELNNENLKN